MCDDNRCKLKDTLWFLFEQTLPYFAAIYSNCRLSGKIKEKIDNPLTFTITDNNLKKALKEVEEFYFCERERKKIIEDKAKVATLAITVSVAFILGSLDFVENDFLNFSSKMNLFYIILLIAGTMYFVTAAISSISALNIGAYYYVNISDHLIKTSDSMDVEYERLDDRKLLEEFYNAIDLNQVILTEKTSLVYASYLSLRNGIIMISFSFLLAVFIFFLDDNELIKKQYHEVVDFHSQFELLGSEDFAVGKVFGLYDNSCDQFLSISFVRDENFDIEVEDSLSIDATNNKIFSQSIDVDTQNTVTTSKY